MENVIYCEQKCLLSKEKCIMKNFSVRVLSAVILLAFVLSLTSCISGDQAKASAEELFVCLSEERYEDAVALFHPLSGVNEESVFSSLAEQMNDAYGAVFSDGMEIVRYTGFRSAAYDTEVGGSRYDLVMEVRIGDVAMTAQLVVIDNDDGYGIFGVHFGE